jgi:hypothetical protein
MDEQIPFRFEWEWLAPSGLSTKDSKYTKTDINRMSVSDLRQIVMGTGVENADIMTGAEMKEYLINLFGL